MSDTTIVKKRVFVISWVLLMLLTFAMLAVGTGTAPAHQKNVFILVMMLAQAYLVAFYFMHLRFEKLPLIVSVVFGILLTALLLYGVLIWEGTRIIILTNP